MAVEVGADSGAAEALARIDDAATRRAVEIERSFLAELGTGCSLPVGAHVDRRPAPRFLAATDQPGTGPTTVAREVVVLDGRDDQAVARATAIRMLARVGG